MGSTPRLSQGKGTIPKTACVQIETQFFFVYVHIACYSASLGRKDGEGGIAFDNEEEKEQWQEDQKVSHTGFPCLCI